jgi:hypothetical protein
VAFGVNFVNNCLDVRRELGLRAQGVGDVVIREDSKIFVSGGWDGKLRVYSYRKLKPLAVLKVR